MPVAGDSHFTDSGSVQDGVKGNGIHRRRDAECRGVYVERVEFLCAPSALLCVCGGESTLVSTFICKLIHYYFVSPLRVLLTEVRSIIINSTDFNTSVREQLCSSLSARDFSHGVRGKHLRPCVAESAERSRISSPKAGCALSQSSL